MRTALVACLFAIGGLLLLPVLALLGAWFGGDAGRWDTLRHLGGTVLPGYAWTSGLLALWVGLGVVLVGGATAVTVTLFHFPGRRTLEWMLMLPLAMPAYVLAYAWTDTLQYSGPLQTVLRAHLGLQGALWPDPRSLGGAAMLFVLCLYPYVYLLARGALAERGVHLMEAARLLGAGTARRILTVALPMARPAIAAGLALALMETFADYGVGSYFGLGTFTTGIYRAWLSMGDPAAAAQLATVLLAVVAGLVAFEQAAQRRLRFATARPGRQARPITLRGLGVGAAWAVCGLPILLGFVLPVLALLRLWWQDPGVDTAMIWPRFAHWCLNSLGLAALTAAAATALALGLGFALRHRPGRALRVLTQGVSLGYAVPGAVIVVGILLPVGAAQRAWPEHPVGTLLTSTVLGLVYAYLVRFSAVALQSVQSGYARVPPSLDESARLLGHGPGSLWRRVHWPLMRRATWTAALLVFVDVMKELPATLVLRPFNADTLAVMAYQLARDERLAEAALPSLAIVAVGLLPVWVLARATRST